MENKKIEKKRIFSKLTVGVAALALISCAFVGGTFARYTTGDTTTPGGVNVADWDIEVVNEGEGFLELAPNMAEHGGSARSYTINGGKVLEIRNNGQVAGKLTLTVDTSTYVMQDKEGNAIDLPEYSADKNNPEWEGVKIKDIFTVNSLTVTKNTSTTAETPTPSPAGDVYSVTLEAGDYVIISIGQVVWKSDKDGETGGKYGDLRDTWLGQNVSMVGYQMTWHVDQAENVPEGGTPTPTP